MVNSQFWRDRRVFVTGHTGFKGGWLCAWLRAMGARVTGFALAPSTEPSFFELCRLASRMESVIGDVRDRELLARSLAASEPEIVFHLAAQPLVRLSYQGPVETLATNIMGTAHLLEAARRPPDVRAVIVITSDKCYDNRGWVWGYRESDPLGGRDPYSASKGCAELVAASYQHSFFRGGAATVATARAGNVIGGGDWSPDRIVPDAVRAFSAGRPLGVRNPDAVRPWQHVLEPLAGYLMLAEKVFLEQRQWEGAWNFGPGEADAWPVSALADAMVNAWGEGASWRRAGEPGAPHEEAYLRLDSSKARHLLKWKPRLTAAEAVAWTVAWYRRALAGPPAGAMHEFTEQQIRNYESRP